MLEFTAVCWTETRLCKCVFEIGNASNKFCWACILATETFCTVQSHSSHFHMCEHPSRNHIFCCRRLSKSTEDTYIGGVNEGQHCCVDPMICFITLFCQQGLKQSADQRLTPLTVGHLFKQTLFQLALQSMWQTQQRTQDPDLSCIQSADHCGSRFERHKSEPTALSYYVPNYPVLIMRIGMGSDIDFVIK